MNILAIETSCDDTAASVIKKGIVASNVISSQYFHAKYGGIIPELASRAHLKIISEITQQSLDKANLKINEIDIIAVTVEPGLHGSLVVGSSFAKGLAIANKLPIFPINHIEGHIYSAMIENPELQFPYISLVVSGGHTALFRVDSFSNYQVVGLTKDDAAGEAFDKLAKLLGLSYPGGPIIDKLSKNGDPNKYQFPRPMINEDNFNFSFSGLKTSVRYFIQNNFNENNINLEINNIAASIQNAITDVLVQKTLKAASSYKIKNIAIAGGVSANTQLREKILKLATQKNINVYLPNLKYCLDNAAMIAFLAQNKINENKDIHFNYKFTVNSKPMRALRNS